MVAIEKSQQNLQLARPNVVLFDWDNTLADTWPTIFCCLERTFKEMDETPLTLEEVKAGARGIHRALRESFPEIFGEARWEQARDLYYKHFRAIHLETTELLPHAVDVLQWLEEQPDIEVGVVSNKTGAYLREEVASTGTSRYFNGILGALDVAKEKPHKDPIVHLLKQYDLPESQWDSTHVWLVGDSNTDAEAAKNAGIRIIRFGTHHGDDTGDVITEDHKALLKLLESCT